MKRRTLGFILLALGLAGLGIALVAIAAEKNVKDKPKEVKAYIGIVPGELTSDLAAQYGVKSGGGVVVEDVSSDSPAEKAGLRENDVITSVNGKAVTGPEEFRNMIGKMKPNDEADVAYVRGGSERTVKVTLGERSDETFGWMPKNMGHNFHFEGQPWEWQGTKSGEKVAYAGLLAEDLSKGLEKYFKVEHGALISEVMKDSPAEKAGLLAGDVITKIGDKAVDDEGDVRHLIQEHKPGDQVDFTVMRDGKEETVKVTLGEHTTSTDTGDFFKLEHDSLGGLTLIPDEAQMEKLKEELNNLKLNLNGIGDSVKVYMKEITIPPIHIETDENTPIHGDKNDLRIRVESHSKDV
jgi:C-terminal processing protease CtpA/Prc